MLTRFHNCVWGIWNKVRTLRRTAPWDVCHHDAVMAGDCVQRHACAAVQCFGFENLCHCVLFDYKPLGQAKWNLSWVIIYTWAKSYFEQWTMVSASVTFINIISSCLSIFPLQKSPLSSAFQRLCFWLCFVFAKDMISLNNPSYTDIEFCINYLSVCGNWGFL